VTLAGQPSKVGGTIARVLGWLILAGGLMIAVTVGVLLQALFPAAVAGWWIGGMFGGVTLAVALALILGGRSLHRVGARAAEDVRSQAIHALAAYKGGVLTAKDVSIALGGTEAEGDALLTTLAKRGDDAVLEVDDDGQMTYRFPHVLPAAQQRWPAAEKARIADAARADVRVGSGEPDYVEVPEDLPAPRAGKAG